ncbi:MAG: helix-turn-helix domain-containing protein [Lachnospiraceae bacterium]|nr:helix-turn-helix domain-containing protein [Lachnospiraceae bacterium]
MSNEVNRDLLMKNMTDNLVVLRNKLQLTQSALATKVGISRQTLMNIENKKRDMSWNTFLALLSVFREDKGTDGLLSHFEIYTPELSKYLISPSANTAKDDV